MKVIIALIAAGFILTAVLYGSIFFMIGMGYGYWGLSIGMAPVLWLVMLAGVTVGFVCAVKNAWRAAVAVRAETRA